MASGAEILSYKGDPNLALGSSQLPASSSVYVSDFDKSFQYWQNYTQRKFEADKAKWDQNNLERAANQKRLEDAISLGNYDIWQEDKDDFLNNYYKPLAELIRKNPTAVDPNNPDYFKFNELLGRAKQAAAFSTQQKAEYDTQSKFSQLHPEAILNLDAPEQYRKAGGIMQRAEMGGINFQPNIPLNPYANQDKYAALIQRSAPTLHIDKGQFGVDLYTITDPIELDATEKAITETLRNEWDGDITNRRSTQQMINSNPAVMEGKIDPFEVYRDVKLEGMKLSDDTKASLHQRWASPFEKAAATQQAKPQDSWLVDLGVEAANPNSNLYKYGNFKGEEFKYYDVLKNGLTINGKEIGAIVYRDGKQYALPTSTKSKEGANVNTYFFDQNKGDYVFVVPESKKFSDLLIPIEKGQFFSKIMQPFLEKTYTEGQQYSVTQDLQNYAETDVPAAFEKLGIPKPQGGKTPKDQQKTVTSQKTKSYTLLELKQTIDFGKMNDSEIIEWYKTNHPEIEIIK